jgi:PAS domain-containing protein
VKTLANPVVLRAAVVLFCGGAAFLMSLIFMRFLRKSINEEAQISSDPTPSLETLPLHLYNTVIQQLKQQKHELDTRSQAEQQRARISETFSQAVLSNLSCGVLVFGTNGLVKTSNPAAREILGFASPSGMSPSDIFRDAKIQRVHRQHEDTYDQEAGTLPDETTEAALTTSTNSPRSPLKLTWCCMKGASAGRCRLSIARPPAKNVFWPSRFLQCRPATAASWARPAS